MAKELDLPQDLVKNVWNAMHNQALILEENAVENNHQE